MLSSPMKVCNVSYSDNYDDMYTSSTETMCDCQNQLGHFDWNGVVREDLPALCRRTMGIKAGDTTISSNNCK
jgi:hypothetical protein